MNFSFDTLQTTPTLDDKILWDFLIIGGGPAGLNAALYAQRKGLKTALITSDIGGQLNNTSAVENYLGFKLMSGHEMAQTFLDHAKSLNIPILQEVYVLSIKKHELDYHVMVSDGKTYRTKTLLVATGGLPRKMNIPGEDDYANRGVSYCAICDGPFYKNKHIIVAGGGNSAIEAALDLSAFASQITIIHRSQFRADQVLLYKMKNHPKIDYLLETQILEIIGQEKMTGVKILDKKTNQASIFEAQGIFIEIGTIPNAELVLNLVKTNAYGEVIVDENQMTSSPGMYAAGDLTTQPHKQIIISAAEGAKAALAANQYIMHHYQGEIYGKTIK